MPVFFSDEMIDQLIEEDVPYSDLTTEILGITNKKGKIVFSTREPTVICCTEEAIRIFKAWSIDKECDTKWGVPTCRC